MPRFAAICDGLWPCCLKRWTCAACDNFTLSPGAGAECCDASDGWAFAGEGVGAAACVKLELEMDTLMVDLPLDAALASPIDESATRTNAAAIWDSCNAAASCHGCEAMLRHKTAPFSSSTDRARHRFAPLTINLVLHFRMK
jgi:hypothetical protein